MTVPKKRPSYDVWPGDLLQYEESTRAAAMAFVVSVTRDEMIVLWSAHDRGLKLETLPIDRMTHSSRWVRLWRVD